MCHGPTAVIWNPADLIPKGGRVSGTGKRFATAPSSRRHYAGFVRRRLQGEYPNLSGADLCGQVSEGDFLVREPVNPVPDRACLTA